MLNIRKEFLYDSKYCKTNNFKISRNYVLKKCRNTLINSVFSSYKINDTVPLP